MVGIAAATRGELAAAARAVARADLSDAFGHVSVRTGWSTALITPPVPLGTVADDDGAVPLDIEGSTLPADAPLEAWLHLAIYRARPDIGAVCRAQPRAVAALTAVRSDLPRVNGHAAMLGDVVVHRDARLIRDAASAASAARDLATADALVLRGNGAVTTGTDLPAAVARMWLLERSAELALRALAAGAVEELDAKDREWWRARAGELLPRIYRYLGESTQTSEKNRSTS
ncbi:MAG: class II aldolase/adducin family protein [Microbacterium sp.]